MQGDRLYVPYIGGACTVVSKQSWPLIQDAFNDACLCDSRAVPRLVKTMANLNAQAKAEQGYKL